MKNKDFLNDLDKKLNNEEITLPESLSAENIEVLINEKGGIVDPKIRKNGKTGKVIKIVSSVAAVFAIVIGVLAATNVTVNKIDEAKQNEIIEQQASQSDYSKIETAVLNYYKDLYNEWQSYNDFDLFDGFGAKNEAVMEDANVANGNSFATGTGVVTDTLTSDLEELQSDNKSHSSTNVQVSGVDEADIIKNDGRYIYYLKNNSVVIVDCQKPENMNIVSEIWVGETDEDNYYTSDMFLCDNQLVVVLNQERYNSSTVNYSSDVMIDCCYALDSDTVIKVYDVKDKSSPELTYSQLISGNYVSSRIVNDTLILVANYNIPYSGINRKNFEDACKEVKTYSVPQYSVNGGEMQKIPSDRIELLDEETPTEYVITAVVDLKNTSSEPMMNAYLGSGTEIYCTQSEMFIAGYEYSTWSNNQRVDVKDDNGKTFSCVTHIYKFDITDEGVLYNTEARVGGRCINQFSMDKYGDYFRIATNDSSTMVYVLDSDMKIVGYLDGIAPGEDMKAARFMDNTLYLVTFFQTDPLFVIDLNDPTAPVVKGELKIPGFSSYLHPIGENLVIGVGEGGTTTGTDGSAKVSLFDVSDPCNPTELDSYVIYDAYFNLSHKAFMMIDDDTFSLCLTKYGYDNYGYREDFEVVVFDVTEDGFSLQGEYDTCEKDNEEEYYWDFRGAFIGDAIFAVNGYGIRSYSMTTKELFGELKY